MDPVTGGVIGSVATGIIALVHRFLEKRQSRLQKAETIADIESTNVTSMQTVINSLVGRLTAIESEVASMHDQLLVAKVRLRRLEVWLIEKGYDPFVIAPLPTVGEDGKINWADYPAASAEASAGLQHPRQSSVLDQSTPASPQTAGATGTGEPPATTPPDSL